MSNITEQIEKLAEEKYPYWNHKPTDVIVDAARLAFANGYKAALQNKVSDISVHNFLEEKLCDHEDESGKFYRGDTVIHLLQEYASKKIKVSDVSAEEWKVFSHTYFLQ